MDNEEFDIETPRCRVHRICDVLLWHATFRTLRANKSSSSASGTKPTCRCSRRMSAAGGIAAGAALFDRNGPCRPVSPLVRNTGNDDWQPEMTRMTHLRHYPSDTPIVCMPVAVRPTEDGFPRYSSGSYLEDTDKSSQLYPPTWEGLPGSSGHCNIVQFSDGDHQSVFV